MKKYLKNNIGLILLFVLFGFLSEWLKIHIANQSGRLIDIAISSDGSELFSLFLLIMILSVAMPLSFYLFTLFIQMFRVRVQKNMRNDLFSCVLNRSYGRYLENPEGSYVAAYTAQIKSLDDSYFFSIFGLIQIVAGMLIALIYLYLIYPAFVLYSLLAIVVAFFVPSLFKPLINRLQDEKLKKVAANIASLNEYLSGLDTILFFNRRNKFKEIFFRQNDEIRVLSGNIPTYMLLSVNLSYLVLQLYTVVAIFMSTTLIASGKLSVGAYIASIHIISDFTGGLSFAANYIQQLSVSKRTLRHIFELMKEDADSNVKKSESGTKMDCVDRIEFRDVAFSYNEKPMIRDFSYRFDRKGIYQIVGASGSGKTTLMNLLCAYLRPQSGNTLVNGVDVTRIQNMSELFTIMRQEAIFFDGTLRENITMFADFPEEKILDGLKQLGISKVQDRLNDTEFSFSGGEERRIMLLRALLRDTDILILDEPLANLDKESIAFAEEMIRSVRDKFVFVITHEPLSIPVVSTISVNFTKKCE